MKDFKPRNKDISLDQLRFEIYDQDLDYLVDLSQTNQGKDEEEQGSLPLERIGKLQQNLTDLVIQLADYNQVSQQALANMNQQYSSSIYDSDLKDVLVLSKLVYLIHLYSGLHQVEFSGSRAVHFIRANLAKLNKATASITDHHPQNQCASQLALLISHYPDPDLLAQNVAQAKVLMNQVSTFHRSIKFQLNNQTNEAWKDVISVLNQKEGSELLEKMEGLTSTHPWLSALVHTLLLPSKIANFDTLYPSLSKVSNKPNLPLLLNLYLNPTTPFDWLSDLESRPLHHFYPNQETDVSAHSSTLISLPPSFWLWKDISNWTMLEYFALYQRENLVVEVVEKCESNWWLDESIGVKLYTDSMVVCMAKDFLNGFELLLTNITTLLEANPTVLLDIINTLLVTSIKLGIPKYIKILIDRIDNKTLSEVRDLSYNIIQLIILYDQSQCLPILISKYQNDESSQFLDELIMYKHQVYMRNSLSLAADLKDEYSVKLLLGSCSGLSDDHEEMWYTYKKLMLLGKVDLAGLIKPVSPNYFTPLETQLHHIKASEIDDRIEETLLPHQLYLKLSILSSDLVDTIDPIFHGNGVYSPATIDLVLQLGPHRLAVTLGRLATKSAYLGVIVDHVPSIRMDMRCRFTDKLLARGIQGLELDRWKQANHIYEVNLIHSGTMEWVAGVMVQCLVLRPYARPEGQLFSPLAPTPLKTNGLASPTKVNGKRRTNPKSSTLLIGHRGLGMNRPIASTGNRIQVGENTLDSLIAAAKFGVDFVEFDVQVTKDLVPILYHDWNFLESGTGIPISQMTERQFRMAYDRVYKFGESPEARGKVLPRSKSLEMLSLLPPPQLTPAPAEPPVFKGNNRNTIQSPFISLSQVLKTLPPHVGLNIEVKYPMQDEATQHSIQYTELEINQFVNSVLTPILNHPTNRTIVFSSFHPAICIALKLKQSRHRVYFLSDVGYSDMFDKRCNSLYEAAKFAKQFVLEGVVVLSDLLIEVPELVGWCKNQEVKVWSYGKLNNEMDSVQQQINVGVDGVIVDDAAKLVNLF